MSIEAEDTEGGIELIDVLSNILLELKLISSRLEEGLETGIELEDVDDDNC
jgi:hypothetical protein